ncbi:FkbM family methyltransferase [Candidatus Rhabdochlamydia porcellionis]|jgi:hypothetical protein|uniref:Methyltransferase FkbM domain-containing protein n=1 Tax=Candidatus Rhabdochlamydia porcellionis TaxID=225148 RepID=A0ABX8YYX0_9BACT|nr:FkbM family methyltransferase [Candidatus Rhabdochlamydia porcellionis]QZA58544.1 hypothetical protein RHAB15C_0000420 [Candidatus Rhabdochlamydia porcellionis]
MKFGNFLVCKILAMTFLTCALESSELSFPFLQASHSADSRTRLNLLDTVDYYSQASQDKFVYMILYGLLRKQDQGYYLEIGAGDPINNNNSYVFEKGFNWRGVSIDISKENTKQWYAKRNNLLLYEDATKSDYGTVLQSFPKAIDYLSLDIDGGYTDVLKKIPFKDYAFKVITIEHDFYLYGDTYRKEERQILESFGYYLLCSDVSITGFCFEDWWIHPSFFSSSELSTIKSLDLKAKDYTQIIQALQVALEK